MDRYDQAARQAALASYDILDTPAEPGFDDLVFVAAQICAAPIALVSLIEQHRQWFKARVGLDQPETPIEQSVCAHGLSGTGLLVIPDLTQDPRTCHNTLVTEDPRIRFYAGAPLIAPEGQAIGMLCVIDYQPRPQGLTPDQARALEGLARQVVVQLELRKALRRQRLESILLEERMAANVAEGDALRERQERDRMAQAAGRIGTFEIDVRSNVITTSPEFCRLFGLPIRPSFDAGLIEGLIAPDEGGGGGSTAMGRATGTAPQQVEYRITRLDDGEPRWISRRSEFVRDPQGAIALMVGAVQDVTERRIVNSEIGHRLKNTLTLVQAIASYTLAKVEDQDAVRVFTKRLQSLGAAHELLMQRSQPQSSMRDVAVAVLRGLGLEERVRCIGEPVALGAQPALTTSMLVHELATNAWKYGALSVPEGTVEMAWEPDPADPAWLVVRWTDRGGPECRPPSRRGFGTRLIGRGLDGRGDVELRYDPAGFSGVFRAPIAELAAR